MALGMFLFSAVDTTAKFLTETVHPVQIVWFRQTGLLIGVLVLIGAFVFFRNRSAVLDELVGLVSRNSMIGTDRDLGEG